MAIITCKECGKEISDRALSCPHCGCPLVINDAQNYYLNIPEKTSKNHRKNNKALKKILLIVISIILICVIVFGATVLFITAKYSKSFNNIKPYLDYVGYELNGSIENTIGNDLYEEIENVEFWGKQGIISYEEHDGYLVSLTWSSFDFVSEDEYRKYAENLCYYFSNEADVELDENFNGNSYEYCYTDNNYDYSVRVGHDLFSYDPEGQIDIRWSCSDNQLKKDEEDNYDDHTIENEREEARDYNEFKSVINECLSFVPDCELYFGSEDTGSSNSYAIKVGDEIVGILGVNMDSYDVIALIDDSKDEKCKYQEQISTAMIMSCDSSIDYETAREIYQKSNDNDSVRIKTGIYGFKGIVNGMNAYAIDISWLH